MKVEVRRFNQNDKSTVGLLFINGVFQCFTLEDTYNLPKKPSETCIPVGIYRLSLQKAGKLYADYAARFKEYKGMILVNKVPNFTGIMIHIGNYPKDTAGCILVGGAYDIKYNQVLNSTANFLKIYFPIANAIENGEIVSLEVTEYGFIR